MLRLGKLPIIDTTDNSKIAVDKNQVTWSIPWFARDIICLGVTTAAYSLNYIYLTFADSHTDGSKAIYIIAAWLY